MTGLGQRVADLFHQKANDVINKAEDPRQALDYAYSQAQDLLAKVRGGLAAIATARAELNAQDQDFARQEAKLEGQAERAVRAGRDDLAHQAMERQVTIEQQRAPIQEQLKQLDDQQLKLEAQVRDLETKVGNLDTQRKSLKAQYDAGQATAAVYESLTGIGNHVADIGGAYQRATEKVQAVQARASALSGLVNDGTLGTIPGISSGDALDDELNKIDSSTGVDDRLSAIKQRVLSSRGPAPELTSGRDTLAPKSTVETPEDGVFDLSDM